MLKKKVWVAAFQVLPCRFNFSLTVSFFSVNSIKFFFGAKSSWAFYILPAVIIVHSHMSLII